MRNLKTTIIFLCSWLVCSIMVSCSDWNDIESLNQEEPGIVEQNPGLYGKYLENLREYKANEHKFLYAWFDNQVKDPFSRAHHISDIPDSVDVVGLMHPHKLAKWELAEMVATRKEKGTKFMFTLSYEGIKQSYEDMLAEREEKAMYSVEVDEFIAYMIDTLKNTLKIVDRYKLDGISIGYMGKSVQLMNEMEKTTYIANENAFIGIIKHWSETHKDKFLVFEGKPQNLVDKTILTSCKHIILSTAKTLSKEGLLFEVLMANEDTVPSDRFILSSETCSLDPTDAKTGYWGDRTRSIPSSAMLIPATYSDFKIQGLGIYMMNNDYYNPLSTYKYTREAISIMNPSLKANRNETL